jgi:hypothetical protein
MQTGTIVPIVFRKQSVIDQLIKNHAPAPRIELSADAEGGQPAVITIDLILGLADEMLNNTSPPKPLTRAHDRRDRHLRIARDVDPGARRGATVVAGAAIMNNLLAEVSANAGTPARAPVKKRKQLPHLSDLRSSHIFRGVRLLRPPDKPAHIRRPEERHSLRRFAVASRASDFLPVSLQGLGGVGMNDKANIRLINPHAERDGGRHHHLIIMQKRALTFRTEAGIKTGMIRKRRHASGSERRGNGLGALSR